VKNQENHAQFTWPPLLNVVVLNAQEVTS